MTDDSLLKVWCGVVRLQLQLALLRRLLDKAASRGQPKRRPGPPRNDDGAGA